MGEMREEEPFNEPEGKDDLQNLSKRSFKK
jgi:hypothetical protein